MAGRKGQLGTSASTVRIGVKCRHAWSPWKRTGSLTVIDRRDCSKCGRTQTRKGDHQPTATPSTDLPKRRSTAPLTKAEQKRQAAIRASRRS
jgi:hypothetical protein